MSHLNICSPSYGQKKGRESNWQFDSRPLKVRNRPFPDVCRESATRHWKARRELQLWFRPHSNRRSEPGDMSSQSPRSPTRDNFETPPWESREKVRFRCGSRGVTQRILYGGRWWLPPSPGRGESSESKVARGLSQHQKGCKMSSNQLVLVLDARPCNNIIVSLSNLIPGLLARPFYPL
jgi:hypothetical protein